MLLKHQKEKINGELSRLRNRLNEIEKSTEYSPKIKESTRFFIAGNINSLKWVERNL